jgi:hypothetical protein
MLTTSPIKKKPVLTNNSFSFLNARDLVEIPYGQHPGAFGYKRKYHTHEGIDLYTEQNTPIFCMGPGKVIDIFDFTGPAVQSPWWKQTQAVLIQHGHFYWLYGELKDIDVYKHQYVDSNTYIGKTTEVLTKNKGRPTTMLHLEKRMSSTSEVINWTTEKPMYLLDPTLDIALVYGLYLYA